MVLRLALGIALGMKIAQDSLLSWHAAQIVGIAIVLQAIDYLIARKMMRRITHVSDAIVTFGFTADVADIVNRYRRRSLPKE